MELKGEQIIELPREVVWNALNDPAVLQTCVPGCESFEPTGENQYKVVMMVAVGPIRSRFTGKLVLSDIIAPQSYKISFDGSGGVAGSGKGHADVSLESVGGKTKLNYSVKAQVGGRLAQVGARLIDGVAKRMADIFFEQFKQNITSNQDGVESVTVDKSLSSRPTQTRWIIVAVVAVIAAILYFSTR